MQKKILNRNQRNFYGATPPILKGITPQQIKNITEKRKVRQRNLKDVLENKKMARIVRPKTKPGLKSVPPTPPPPRPADSHLYTVDGKITTIPTPEVGAFNGGLIAFDNSYIMVYRPNEYAFRACILDKELNLLDDTLYQFDITNCADPRLIWTPDNKLLMVYSSTEEVGLRQECIRGAIIMDRNHSDKFIRSKSFNISLPAVKGRQKNWTPFRHKNEIYLIGTICPHIIYEIKLMDNHHAECRKRWETHWHTPWFYNDFFRGNTNAVQLDNGNYLNTFHTAVRLGSMHYYDNGFYEFEGKPPFKVVKCANKTFLPAEAAVSKHFRKRNIITVCFPIGMVREEEDLIISYGDNDSEVKIFKTTVKEAQKTMVPIY